MSVIILTVVLFTGCRPHQPQSPSVAAQRYAENLKTGNYDEFVNALDFDSKISADSIKREKARLAAMMRKKVHPAIAGRGGLKEMKVVSEKVAPDGKIADVVLKNVYNNGEVENIHYVMVNTDNVWKVRMGNDKEVWKTHTADGHEVVLELKEDEHRDIIKTNVDGENREFVKVIEEENREMLKVKENGEKDVVKVIEKSDEEVVKVKKDGVKEVEKIEK